MMHSVKPKLVRITTVPVSLRLLLKGQMKFMKEQGFEVVMISSPGDDAAFAEQQEECEMITLPMERTVSLLADLQSLIRLTRILKNLEPDIVHTHTPKAGLLGMLAARLAGVPVRMHTIAGLPWMETTGFKRFVLKQMEKLTMAAAHRVYPNSKGLLEFLKKENISPGEPKLKLLGNGSSNGIDCTYFSKAQIKEQTIAELKQKTGLQQGAWIWIFAGRLVKEKGIHELLSAYEQIAALYPGDQLWLLGEEEPQRDPLTEDNRNMIQQHPGIHAWGFQQDVRPFFAAADVLVFPSYREGLPNVPLQAGAMGCALLLSNINGCNEIVEDGVNGLLVSPKNKEQLFDAMLQLRRQPHLQQQFANLSRQRIKQLYGREEIWKLLLAEYRSLLNAKNT
jgi:glycosyltransferase involved in cell wall biosynthesis